MSQFGTQERKLLLALKNVESPSTDDVERVKTKLDLELLGAAGVIAGANVAVQLSQSSGTALSVSSTFAKSLAAKWLAGVIIATGVGATTMVMLSEEGSVKTTEEAVAPAKKSAVEDAAKARNAPPAPSSEPLSVGASGPSHLEGPSEAPREKAKANGSFRRESIDEEVSLVAEAQRALGRGDANTALLLLEKHRDRYPRGALATERKALYALGLCQAGRREEGKRLGAQFLAMHPTSPLGARVRRGCELPAVENADGTTPPAKR